MGKLLVRLTVIIVSIYFLLCYYVAQIHGIDILQYTYSLLFELITLVYCYSEGKYHCKFLKHTMMSIFLCDVLTRIDHTYNFLSVDAHNLIPIGILAIGMGTSLTLAIKHFYKVNKLKYGKRKNRINYG